jgi:hypothetical protein
MKREAQVFGRQENRLEILEIRIVSINTGQQASDTTSILRNTVLQSRVLDSK